MFVYAIHHDEYIYPDPDVFNPDRFTEEEKRKRGSMSFLPLGKGPRIAFRFRMLQARKKKRKINEKTKPTLIIILVFLYPKVYNYCQ